MLLPLAVPTVPVPTVAVVAVLAIPPLPLVTLPLVTLPVVTLAVVTLLVAEVLAPTVLAPTLVAELLVTLTLLAFVLPVGLEVAKPVPPPPIAAPSGRSAGGLANSLLHPPAEASAAKPAVIDAEIRARRAERT